MRVETIVPIEISNIKERIGNITKQKSLLKIYNALSLKSKYKNKEGYFEVSSRYLRKVNGRYNEIIDFLIENNIIETFKREYLLGDQYGPTDLFVEKIDKVSYSSGRCIRYKFLVDISKGVVEEISFEDPKVDKKWYKILMRSLETLGYHGKVSRDQYGARVYHNLTMDYKQELQDKGYCTIDSVTSQPRLIYLMMKDKGLIDERYFDIFESGRDFYLELVSIFDLTDRKEAKDLFMHWALGNGYTKGYKMYELFPNVCKFLKDVKSTNYKDSSRYLSWKESRIFIDDLLNNLPVSFGIPIHDCIIVKQRDANKVLSYCENKYPQLKFKVELI